MPSISNIQLQDGVYDIKDKKARENIQTINNYLNLLQNRKVIIFSDSYGTGYNPVQNTTPFTTLFQQYLGLDNDHFKQVCEGGYCFNSNLQKNFSALINAQTLDEDVTDVIIAGGYNDYTANEANIGTGISNCATSISQKYPNAKKYIAFIANTSNYSIHYDVMSNVPIYIKNASLFGFHFLGNVQYALHNYYSEISSDTIHPTQDGQNAIAEALVQAFLNGNADVIKPYVTPNPDLGSFGISMENNLINFVLTTNYQLTYDEAITVVCTGRSSSSSNTKLKLLDLSNGYAIGNSRLMNQGNLDVVVQLQDGTYRDLHGKIIIENNALYFYPVRINSTNNNYETYQVKTVQLAPFNFMLDALYN